MVVKFPLTYNTRAHRLLADCDLTPELIYDGTEGPRYLFMIIMDYVKGGTPQRHLDNHNVKLIDYDWCGVHQVDQYPFIIGDAIEWASGVGPLAIMHKDHDLYMLKRLEVNIRAALPGAW